MCRDPCMWLLGVDYTFTALCEQLELELSVIRAWGHASRCGVCVPVQVGFRVRCDGTGLGKMSSKEKFECGWELGDSCCC